MSPTGRDATQRHVISRSQSAAATRDYLIAEPRLIDAADGGLRNQGSFPVNTQQRIALFLRLVTAHIVGPTAQPAAAFEGGTNTAQTQTHQTTRL